MTAGRTPHRIVQPEGMHRSPSYVHAVRAGNTLYLAGQVGRDAEGKPVGPDAATQAKQIYANIGRILAAAGADWTDVVKVTTYLLDRGDTEAVSAVRFQHFGDYRPPHTALIVAGLGSPELRVEVDIVAVLPT